MEQIPKKEPKYIKAFIILILVLGAGLLLYYQTEKFFAEKEVASQLEVQQAYEIGIEKGKVDLHNEWKEAGKKEVIDQILNQLVNTGQLQLKDVKGNVVILVPKQNEPTETTE